MGRKDYLLLPTATWGISWELFPTNSFNSLAFTQNYFLGVSFLRSFQNYRNTQSVLLTIKYSDYARLMSMILYEIKLLYIQFNSKVLEVLLYFVKCSGIWWSLYTDKTFLALLRPYSGLKTIISPCKNKRIINNTNSSWRPF